MTRLQRAWAWVIIVVLLAGVVALLPLFAVTLFVIGAVVWGLFLAWWKFLLAAAVGWLLWAWYMIASGQASTRRRPPSA